MPPRSHRVHRPVRVSVMILDDLYNASAAKPSHGLRVGMLVAHLRHHERDPDVLLHNLGKTFKVCLAFPNPDDSFHSLSHLPTQPTANYGRSAIYVKMYICALRSELIAPSTETKKVNRGSQYARTVPSFARSGPYTQRGFSVDSPFPTKLVSAWEALCDWCFFGRATAISNPTLAGGGATSVSPRAICLMPRPRWPFATKGRCGYPCLHAQSVLRLA